MEMILVYFLTLFVITFCISGLIRLILLIKGG